MPSGDTAQAAIYAAVLSAFLGHRGWWLLLPAGAFGRVWYHCHWIGDTLVAAVISRYISRPTAAVHVPAVTFPPLSLSASADPAP